MSRFAIALLAAALAACTSASAKRVTTAPQTATAAACPLHVIDGVVQAASCAPAMKGGSPKCDASSPVFVVDGVAMLGAYVKPEGE